jgi:hypothetical protein
MHEISIPKRVRHHFWPWLLTKNTHTHNYKEQPTYSLRLLIMLLLISELGTLTAIFFNAKGVTFIGSSAILFGTLDVPT